MKDVIRRAVYEKYIAPTKADRPDYIGVEIEMPVVNLNGEAVDEQIAIQTAEAFSAHFRFEPENRDAEGNFISARHPETGDILSFDCSYSNLELSFGKATGLFEIKERFEKIYPLSQCGICKVQLHTDRHGYQPRCEYQPQSADQK
jgi:gamma-glutamylcysteine synthetase